jgi:membrane-bound lytic murein transglycosylase D
VPGGLPLSRIARAVGIEVDALAALNPELKKSRIPPDVKSWELHIPTERAAHFKDKWPQYQPETPTHRTHVLRLGERLAEVAELYGTTVSKLQVLNDFAEGEVSHAGMKLLVPDVEPTPKAKGERPTVGIPGDIFLYVDRKRIFYRATEGDQLDEVARFFKITSDEIRMWNQISSDAKLHRGMYLQLFVPSDAELSQAVVLSPDDVRTLVVGSEEFFQFHETQANRVRIRYRVKAGDTLRSLADRFDLSVGSLARINQFSRDKQLDADSEIIVYVPEDAAKRLAAD